MLQKVTYLSYIWNYLGQGQIASRQQYNLFRLKKKAYFLNFNDLAYLFIDDAYCAFKDRWESLYTNSGEFTLILGAHVVSDLQLYWTYHRLLHIKWQWIVMLYLFIRKIELPHYYASLKQQYKILLHM